MTELSRARVRLTYEFKEGKNAVMNARTEAQDGHYFGQLLARLLRDLLWPASENEAATGRAAAAEWNAADAKALQVMGDFRKEQLRKPTLAFLQAISEVYRRNSKASYIALASSFT